MSSEHGALSVPLAWPKAYPECGCSARFKVLPEDFQVDETLAFVPLGTGEHLYLRIQKQAVTTSSVARELAGLYGTAERDVGYAGMKDKRALSSQWFSIPTPQDAGVARAAGYRVRASDRHVRKLRRGQLARNDFVVRLRDVCGSGWPQRLALLAADGFPNYFGPQRFGTDNLSRALTWLPQRRRRRIARFKQGLYLSVLRSYLFNEVLAARVRDCSWNRLLPGDVPVAADAALNTGAGTASAAVPSGPLWGRGRSATADLAATLEEAALVPFAEVCEGLEYAGLQQQRRALLVRPGQLEWQAAGRDVLLQFQLPPGSYATSFLGEVFELAAPAAAVGDAARAVGTPTMCGRVSHEPL